MSEEPNTNEPVLEKEEEEETTIADILSAYGMYGNTSNSTRIENLEIINRCLKIEVLKREISNYEEILEAYELPEYSHNINTQQKVLYLLENEKYQNDLLKPKKKGRGKK